MTRHDTEHPHDLISAFADGELTPAERDFVENHLKACAECRTLLEDLRRLSSAVAEEEPPPVPTDLTARIRWQLRGTRPSPERSPRRRVWLSPIPMSAAAGLLVVAAVVWVLRTEYRMSPLEGVQSSRVADQKAPETLVPQDSLKKEKMKERFEESRHYMQAMLDAPADAISLDKDLVDALVLGGDGLADADAESILGAPEPPPGRQSTALQMPSLQEKKESVGSADSRVDRQNLETREQLEAQKRQQEQKPALSARQRDLEGEGINSTQFEDEMDMNMAFRIMPHTTSATGIPGARAMLVAAPSFNVWLTDSGQISITAGSYSCSVQTESVSEEGTASQKSPEQAEVEAIFAQIASIEGAQKGSAAEVQIEQQLFASGRTKNRMFFVDAGGKRIEVFALTGPEASGETLEIQTRILRLLQEQMRSSLEKLCGPLPHLEPSGD